MQIGETINGSIVSKLNGALTNADALPVAEIYIDGATASTATVTPLSVGEYLYEFVTAGTVGQDVSVRVTGVIGGESFADWDYYGELESAPVSTAAIVAMQAAILAEINDGVTLTDVERTAVATAVEAALLNEGDGQQLLQAIVDTIEAQTDLENLTLAAIKAQVDTALADYDAPTRAEATSDKNEILSAAPSLDLPAIADAVWDEGLSAHITVGSAGKKLGDQLNAPSQTLADYKADVSAIPVNPLLTDDERLDHLDADISGIGGGSQQVHVGCDVDVTVEDDLIEAEVLCKT